MLEGETKNGSLNRKCLKRGSELRGFFELVRNLEGCYMFGSDDANLRELRLRNHVFRFIPVDKYRSSGKSLNLKNTCCVVGWSRWGVTDA